MIWFSNIYIYLIFASFFVTLGIAIYVFLVHKTPVARAYAQLLLIMSLWLAGSGFSAISPSEFMAEFWWYKVRFSAIIFIGYFFLRFVLLLSVKHKNISPKSILYLAAAPSLFLLLSLTNGYHGLFYYDTSFVNVNDLMLRKEWSWGILYWPHATLVLVYALVSFVILAQRVIESNDFQKKQSLMILISLIIPIFGGIPQSLAITTWGVDFLGFAATLSCIINAIALFKYQLFEITPIARNNLIESMEDGVIVVDTNMKIIDINPATRKIINKPMAAILGKELKTVLPQLNLDYVRESSNEKKTIALAVNGDTLEFDMNTSPIYDPEKNKIGLLIVLRNISELKELIEDLDAYARTVAHDLKNPVNTLRWYTELSQKALESQNSSDVPMFLNAMWKLSSNMNSIIDELLLFAGIRKVDDNDLAILNMNEITENVLNRLSELTENKKAKIILPEKWPQIKSYAPWIEEVLANYISNAVKYGGSPPVVEIGASRYENGYIRFYVRDNGTGIEKVSLKSMNSDQGNVKILEPDGRAFALSIVHRIITKLKGRTGVDKESGKGNTFYFILPDNLP